MIFFSWVRFLHSGLNWGVMRTFVQCNSTELMAAVLELLPYGYYGGTIFYTVTVAHMAEKRLKVDNVKHKTNIFALDTIV